MAGLGLGGRLAVVTGGTRGIGWAIAERLIEEGADVIATGRAPDGRVPEGARYEAADFAQPEQARAFADKVRDWEPDILVNNAGTSQASDFIDVDAEDFATLHRLNVIAPMLLCQAALVGMRRREWGRIVQIGAMGGTMGLARRASYASTKFGLDGMNAALAAEEARNGILANVVAPGFIGTDLAYRLRGPAEREELAKRIPVGRLGTPAEVASLVAWLASPENGYVSGQCILIDGGYARTRY